jgi:hypothetical protein
MNASATIRFARLRATRISSKPCPRHPSCDCSTRFSTITVRHGITAEFNKHDFHSAARLSIRFISIIPHFHVCPAGNNASIDYRQGMVRLRRLSLACFSYVNVFSVTSLPFCVQNVLAGTLLYNFPEPDAFFAMDRLIMHYFPLYWLPTLDGATAGCKVRLHPMPHSRLYHGTLE